MNPLWVRVTPLSQKSEPHPWGLYQNIRPDTKRPDTIWYLVFLYIGRGMGLERLNATVRCTAGKAC